MGYHICLFHLGRSFSNRAVSCAEKHIPKYGFSFHILALLSALLGWSSISGFAIKGFPPEEFVRLKKFSYAIFFGTHDAQSFFSNFINRSRGNLFLARMITAAAVFIGPAFMVCMAAMCLRSFPSAMLFVVLAAAAIAISEVFFDLFFRRRLGVDVLNNRAWSERCAIIFSWSASSAIGASISAIGIGPVVEQCDTDRMR